MIASALWVAFACYGLALVLNMVQVLLAPLVGDRLLALDTMSVNAVALVILFGIASGSGLGAEPALLLAMFGFIATVGYAKFLLRGRVIE